MTLKIDASILIILLGACLLNKIKNNCGLLFLILALAGFNTSLIAEVNPQVPVNSITAKEVENYLSGKFNPAKHPAFVKVPKRFANRKGYYLREEAFDAFKQMHAAARKDNVNLIIRSATRNFDYQKWIWNRKWKEKSKSIPNQKRRVKNILKYNSMPGTSRHHWGTEVDLNSFNNGWFTYGKGLKLFKWMNNNAHKYGFHRPYTIKNDQRSTGYKEEKWHWSYTPLSKLMLADVEGLLTDKKISGFSGSEHAVSLSIVKNYIFAVDPSCR